MTVSELKDGHIAPPRSVGEIKRQIADLTTIKSAADTYGVRDFASQVGMDTVFSHEAELVKELRAAERDKGALEIR